MRTSGLSLDQAPPEDIPFRFFLSAPLFGIMAGMLIAVRGNVLFTTTWQLETVALTHLITLGWIVMTMMGAFYQMVPVLVGGQVPYLNLSKIVHVTLILGTLTLVIGLLFHLNISFLIAIVCLIIAFAIFITQISLAVFKVKADRSVVVAMRISIISLAFTVFMGVLSAGAFATFWTFLLDRTAIKGIHLTLGLLGWVGCLIIGVGIHLIPMFYLTPPFPKERAKWILRGIMLSLVLLPPALLAKLESQWLILVGSPGLLGVCVFVGSIYIMLKQRKRKIVDTPLRFWQVGLVTFPLSFLFLPVYAWWPNQKFLFLFGLLFLVGFVLSITTGMLYKIVPFLVWFHRFSSLAGQVGVPLLKDILPDRFARRQWQSFIVMFVLLSMGMLIQSDIIIRLGGIGLILSSALLFSNIYKAIFFKWSA